MKSSARERPAKGRVVFLTEEHHDGIGAAARLRVYQYLPLLEKEGYSFLVRVSRPSKNFLSGKKWLWLKRRGKVINALVKGVVGLLMAFHRFIDIMRIRKSDIVFLQRDMIPAGFFPLHEWLVCKLFRNTIFDFDDAVFLHFESKIRTIISRCDRVIAGNRYLAAYAEKYNGKVTVIPTSMDTANYSLKTFDDDKGIVTIGWSGTDYNLGYLMSLKGALGKLGAKYGNIELLVISNESSVKVEFEDIPFRFVEWTLEREVADLHGIDIGIMPLEDDPWCRGKCAGKLLVYMSCGIASVASSVGANKELVEDGVNGFLAGPEKEWVEKLSRLIEDPRLRKEVGLRGRKTIEEAYSIRVNAPLLEAVLDDRTES